MPKPDPGPKGAQKVAVIEDIDITLAVRIVAHGGRFYLSVRPRDIEFWDLKVGDEVLVKIVKCKRSRGSAFKEDDGS